MFVSAVHEWLEAYHTLLFPSQPLRRPPSLTQIDRQLRHMHTMRILNYDTLTGSCTLAPALWNDLHTLDVSLVGVLDVLAPLLGFAPSLPELSWAPTTDSGGSDGDNARRRRMRRPLPPPLAASSSTSSTSSSSSSSASSSSGPLSTSDDLLLLLRDAALVEQQPGTASLHQSLP